MLRVLRIHIIFLAIAVIIAFVLIPLEQFYFGQNSTEEIKQYYRDAFIFESGKAWKIVFTWFIGLSCGRLMLRALARS